MAQEKRNTKAVVPAASGSGSGGPKGVMVRNVVPSADPMFMLVQRLKQIRDKVIDPYSQDVWSYAAISAVAKPISSVPPVFYRRRTDGSEMPPPGIRSSIIRKRVRAIQKLLVSVPREIAEHIASIPNTRERFSQVRRLAPYATPSALCRAVGDLEQVFDDPWINAFRLPNEHCTANQLWEATVVNLRADGRCFWVLRDKTGTPVAESEIPAQIFVHTEAGFAPIVDKSTGQVTGWNHTYVIAGKSVTKTYKPYQVLLFHYFDRDNYLKGTSPNSVAKKWIDMVYYAVTHNINFFKNGAVIGGILQTEDVLTNEQTQQIKGEAVSEHQGVDKAFDLMVLSGGLRWIPNQATHKDMDFMKGLDAARDAIFAAHRTPRSVTGISEDYNKANQEASTKAHWEMNLIPDIVYLETITNSHLMTDDRRGGVGGVWMAFDLSQVEALREDLWQKMRTAKMMSEMGYTLNAINKRLGLGMRDVPWGDTWYRQINTLPVNDKETENPAPPPKDPGAPPDGGDGTNSDGNSGNDGGGGDTNTGSGYAAPPTADQLAAYSRARILLTEAEGSIKARYRKFLTSDLRAHQLQLVASGSPTVFDSDTWAHNLRKAMVATYEEVFSEAFQSAVRELPESIRQFSTSTSEMETVVDHLMDRLAEAVSRIGSDLARVYEESPSDLEAATRTVFNRLATGPRLAIVGVNEAGAVVSAARDEVFRRAGVNETRWIRSRGPGADRPTHTGYERLGPVPYGESFSQTLTIRRPHDPAAPATERLGCWCIVVPITGEE